MKKTGVWMDNKRAYLVTVYQGGAGARTQEPGFEFFDPEGGSRSKTLWDYRQLVHDRKYSEREDQQFREYFDDLAKALKTSDAIFLHGPAQINSGFEKRLDRAYPGITSRVRKVLTEDSMSDDPDSGTHQGIP